EEMQPVVERAKHAHQRCGLLYSETEMLRRIQDQRRIKDSEPQRREDLNEKQRSRSLRSLGKTACEKVHPALLCCSTRGAMSSSEHRINHRGTQGTQRQLTLHTILVCHCDLCDLCGERKCR